MEGEINKMKAKILEFIPSQDKPYATIAHYIDGETVYFFGRIKGKNSEIMENALQLKPLSRKRASSLPVAVNSSWIITTKYSPKECYLMVTFKPRQTRERSNTPREAIKTFSGTLPLSSYAAVMRTYSTKNNWNAMLEVYDTLLRTGLEPDEEIIGLRNLALSHL